MDWSEVVVADEDFAMGAGHDASQKGNSIVTDVSSRIANDFDEISFAGEEGR